MLAGLKAVSSTGATKMDFMIPATRRFVREEVALAHISASENQIQIENIYNILEKNGLKVERIEDETVFNLAVQNSIQEKTLLKEESAGKLARKIQERKMKREEKKVRAQLEFEQLKRNLATPAN